MNERKLCSNFAPDDRVSEISELTDDSFEQDDASCASDSDYSYDSVDDIDEDELQNLLYVTKLESREFDPIVFSPQKRKRCAKELEVESTADAIFDLLLETISPNPIRRKLAHSQRSSPTAFTTNPLSYSSESFHDIIVDRNINSFWNSIMTMDSSSQVV